MTNSNEAEWDAGAWAASIAQASDAIAAASARRRAEADVVAEVIGAIDLYRMRHLRSLPAHMSLFPVIVSNGTFTSAARRQALECDVELIGDLELWKLLNQTPCTRAELEAIENRRAESMKDVQAALRRFGM